MKQIFAVFIILFGSAAYAETTCYGEGAYRVCTTFNQRSDGSISITSSDTMGNSYRLNSDVQAQTNGDTKIRSYDSMGNSYSIESWTDARGSHSRDSTGNVCSVLKDGTIIGCGQ